MTRGAARTTVAAHTPEHRQLGDLLTRMAREADSRIPAERRARRRLQEMMPGYERQPVLILHRPVMADDSCPQRGRWTRDPSICPPASAAPAPAASGQWQCDRCGNWFGVAGAPAGPVVAWTCGACQSIG
ncbi:hypothetical protein [Streptomyces solaniscabiei]|uniref:hypothetical protein n=1 Tax=Streptomyces solaniscabiei TaxID=2683255 RepID=UPI001CE3ABC7|nr:hypothetical protein [Streptomyces solaniscabiei]